MQKILSDYLRARDARLLRLELLAYIAGMSENEFDELVIVLNNHYNKQEEEN